MYFCKLRISGESLNPAQVTEILGIEPDKSQKKGQIKEPIIDNAPFEEGVWLKGIETVDYQMFNDSILEFLKPFAAKKEEIGRLCKEFEVSLYINLYPDDYHISFFASPDIIDVLAQLGIGLHITVTYLDDLYKI